MKPALAEPSDSCQIECVSEVDGITLDGIPYLRDGAVLLDDLPKDAPAPKAKPTETAVLALVTPPTLHPQTEAQAKLNPARSDQAERGYQEARVISALRAETAPAADAPRTDKPNPDPLDFETAPSVDKRA